MIGACLAERPILRRTPRRPATARLPPGHRNVAVLARLPDALAAPRRRGLQRIERGRVSRPEAERHAVSRTGAWNAVATFFDGVDNRSTSERHRRPDTGPFAFTVGSVGRSRSDPAVPLLVHPVTQRDDDIALDALWPRRLGKRQPAFRDASRPVTVVGEGRRHRGPVSCPTSAAGPGPTARDDARPRRARGTSRALPESCAWTAVRAHGTRCSRCSSSR